MDVCVFLVKPVHSLIAGAQKMLFRDRMTEEGIAEINRPGSVGQSCLFSWSQIRLTFATFLDASGLSSV